MTTSNPITDPRAKRWGNAAKWLLLFPLGFVIAPYIFTAIWGLFGLAIGILCMVGAWMLRPWVFMKAANARLYFIKAEARKNPVETLQEDLKEKVVAWEERKNATNRLKAQILNLEDKLASIKTKWGVKGDDYLKLLNVRDNLAKLYAHRLQRLDEAHIALGKWAREIDRANDIWEAAQAAAEAQETSGMTEDDFFAKLKTDTALDSIQTNFNTALASLDTELATSDNPPVLGSA